jgi:hypothetical protein
MSPTFCRESNVRRTAKEGFANGHHTHGKMAMLAESKIAILP